jgi:hypothetical protein
VKMINVNYRAEAGLYHRVIGGWKTLRSATSASEPLLLGASLEVGDERYNEAKIRQLYVSEAYSLKRHSRR